MARHETRAVGGLLVSLLGGLVLLSAALVNPWTLGFWRLGDAVDFADVYRRYFWTALVLGLAVVALGRLVARAKSPGPAVLSVFALPIVLAVLVDRALLAHFGLPLWTYDAERRFQHRPGARRLTHRGSAVAVINAHGHHDDEFPVEKPQGELRGLFLGDSVVMGDKLRSAETFVQRLERRLIEADADGPPSSYQMINAGVQGYATEQELETLRRDLRFDPDFVVVGFCLNDVVEPYVVDLEKGGTGLDYHKVVQTQNPLMGYLVNETGFGRLVWWTRRQEVGVQLRSQWEANRVADMARLPRDDARFAPGWNDVEGALEGIYALCAERGVKVLLVVFPYRFQLLDEATWEPQRFLGAHAAEHGVPCLDLTAAIRELVFDDPEMLALLRQRGLGPAEIARRFKHRTDAVFLDESHFAPEGHARIAVLLHEQLEQLGWLR